MKKASIKDVLFDRNYLLEYIENYATYYYYLGDTNVLNEHGEIQKEHQDKYTNFYLVMGWTKREFDENFKEYFDEDGYALCCKIAVNDSSLQCDYDIDWTMPFDEEDVLDTEDFATEEHISELLKTYNEKFFDEFVD